MHCSTQTTESLFEIAEALLRLCRRQHTELELIGAADEAEAEILAGIEREVRELCPDEKGGSYE